MKKQEKNNFNITDVLLEVRDDVARFFVQKQITPFVEQKLRNQEKAVENMCKDLHINVVCCDCLVEISVFNDCLCNPAHEANSLITKAEQFFVALEKLPFLPQKDELTFRDAIMWLSLACRHPELLN